MHDVRVQIDNHMSSKKLLSEAGVKRNATHNIANMCVHANVNAQSAFRRHTTLSLSNACNNTNSRPNDAKGNAQRHDDACRQFLTKKQGLPQQLQVSQATRNQCLMPTSPGAPHSRGQPDFRAQVNTVVQDTFMRVSTSCLSTATAAHQDRPVIGDLTARCPEMCSTRPITLTECMQ